MSCPANPKILANDQEEKEQKRVHNPPAPDNHLDARAVRRRAHRLWARPLEAFWQQRRRVPQGASTRSDGGRCHGRLRGIWERLHYDWSDPNHVVLATTDSNTWGGASGHTYTFTRRPDGLTDIDVVVVREGKNLKGKLLGFVVGTIGTGVLKKAFVNSVKAIEARNGAASERMAS